MEVTTTQQSTDPRVHIYAPKSLTRWLRKSHCPVCKKSRYFITYTFEWFGPSGTCLGCGDHWQDGELIARPFMRAWRTWSKQEAKRRWRHETERLKGGTEHDHEEDR